MQRYAVWALGADRPGIVAAVTGALLDRGGNLADCSMTILGGEFAMVLLVDAPEGVDVGLLERALDDARAEFDLVVAVRAVGHPEPGVPGVRFELAVHGADRPGIVHHVAAALATHQVNITDLSTRVVGDPDAPLYTMLVDVTVPATTDRVELEAAVAALAADLDVTATLHPVDADVL